MTKKIKILLEWLMIPCCFKQNYQNRHLLYVIAWWKIIFFNSKWSQTHLLM